MDPDRERPADHDGEDVEYVPEDDRVIGVAFRWSLLVIALVAVVAVAILWLRRETPQPQATVDRGTIEAPDRLQQPAQEIPEVRWTGITREAGIDFVHVNGADGRKLLPETMGAGAAFFDRDGDGDPDLLFVDSDRWADGKGPRGRLRLYDNDGTGRFRDATAGSGLEEPIYGQGVAVGDYDGDGRPDVFVSAVGANRLYRNEGGRFRDVTASAGVAGESGRWSTSAGFFDYDNDGDLDLFVCNYVLWTRDIDLTLNFTLNGTDRAYGPPNQYRGTYSYLYRNEGDGRFVDVSAEAGIHVDNPATGEPLGKALALTFADAERDGDLDVFVANDTVQNFLFLNQGDGTFRDIGALSGLGFDGMGNATGAMGIDTGDFANDGVLGIGIGNFANETTSFYVQQGDPLQFVDVANARGIGSPSRLKLSFGLFFFDYDLDGRLDLLQANGHLEDEINEIQPSQHYRQPTQLFWNTGGGVRADFAAVPEDRLGDLGTPIVGRAAAYADIDADGDLDVVLTQVGGPPLLVRNDQETGHHWLRVRLEGEAPNRDAIGARVRLEAGGKRQERLVMPTRSYLAQVELPVTFGLGEATGVDRLVVVWPDGAEQTVEVPGVDRTMVVRRAAG